MIKIGREGTRELSPDFRRKLEEYNRMYGPPEVDIRWNPTSVNLGHGRFDPRWEIWIEVTDNTKQKRTVESEGDVRSGMKTWRFLNTWQYADKSFAPLDNRVFRALREADTWKHAETFHEVVELPERYRKEEEFKALQDTAYGMRTNLRRGWI
jgi:hypothetical protein